MSFVFEVKSKLKDSHAKLEYALQRMVTNDLNKLELWDVEPYQVRDNKPRWCWNIESENGELRKPIIQPCNVNWNLRWTKNGQIIKEDKVKYFGDSENSIEFCPFMFVEKLKG